MDPHILVDITKINSNENKLLALVLRALGLAWVCRVFVNCDPRTSNLNRSS